MNHKSFQFIILVIITFTTSACWNLRDTLEPTSLNQDDDANSPEGREGLLDYQKLSYNGKLLPQFTSLSAIGTNGERSEIYFGSTSESKKLFVFNHATKKLVTLDTRVKKTGQNKFEKHGKKGHYNAASKASTISVPKNPADKTQISMIVPGPNEHAVIALNGLDHRRGGIKGTAAHGGIMEVQGSVVKGVWGNVLGSLNSADSKEIQTVTVLKDSWIAFSKDANSIGAFRKFDDELDEAQEGPTGVEGNSIGTIVTAAFGAGTDLFLAYEGYVKLRKTKDIKEICEIDIGEGAAGLDTLAKPEDLQTFPEANEIMVVSALAVIGRTLLIGLENYSGNSGGVARIYLDTPELEVVRPPRSQLGMTIKHIAPSEDGQSALISTAGRGLLYYFDNMFIEISEKTLKILSDATPSKKYPLILEGMKDAKEDGLDFSKATVGAVNIGNMWYVATLNGIYQLRSSVERMDELKPKLDNNAK